MTTTPSMILQEARRLIAAGWTRGTFARTKSGKVKRIESKAAVRFCLVGAVDRARLNLDVVQSAANFPVTVALDALQWEAGTSLTRFNDCANREEVLAVIDAALAEVTK